MTPEQLAARIRELRQTAGLTQTQAAKAAGIAAQTWRRWETGYSLPKATRMSAIAAAVNKPIEALYLPTGQTAVTTIIITDALLERIRTNGRDELNQVTKRLTTDISSHISTLSEQQANNGHAKPRGRRAPKPFTPFQRRKPVGI